jgi:hypothetical protein
MFLQKTCPRQISKEMETKNENKPIVTVTHGSKVKATNKEKQTDTRLTK